MKTNRSSFASMLLAGACAAASLAVWHGAGFASVVADWNADSLSTGAITAGGTWTDSVNSINASAAGSGLVVSNTTGLFNGHNYISFGGAGNFVVPSGSAAQPISDFSITAVFSTTTDQGGDFSGNNDWYNANGLVGNEQGGIQTDWGFGVASNSEGVVFGEGNPTAGVDQEDRANYTYNTGSTTIATVTRDASTGAVTIYINGMDVAQSYLPAGTTTMDTADRLTSTFLIGAMYSGGGYFTGNIAQVQIANSVVNSAETYNNLATTYGLAQVAVPEPASLGICAVGAVGLLWLKRRRLA